MSKLQQCLNSLIVFLLVLNIAESRKFGRCELVKELKRHHIPNHEILEWVCIAEFESSFNTKAINSQNSDGSWDWGLFQINDRYWCTDKKKYTSNMCRRNCYNFLKSDISQSLSCARLIQREQGFSAWVAWNRHCQGYVQTPKSNREQEENNENDEESDEFDSEEEGETNVVEKAFKFEDFAKRLVNPKVVRACTIVLSEWEKIPTKSLKAAVTILHRIAYGSHCPAMLYQAILFRIFQSVLDTPREQHHEELRRLAIYVIRKFVETAPSNPKIYAELLFYKTVREANELETGYCDNYEAGTKGAWSEEQEHELRILFEENQRNPETDQDVIDWILDNLIDKTRTRRGVLKKLKEMGLMFKAPTKKSSAGNKHLWQREEDEQLKELYDEHRLDEKCLNKIVEVMGIKRSQRAIVKRMIELHLIADKSEILPSKRGKKSQNRNSDTSDDSDSDGWISSRDKLHQNLKKTKKQIVRKVLRNPLDLETLKDNVAELNEEFTTVINWLIESLQEASEDIEEQPNNQNNSDSDVPLFPITTVQIRAVEDDGFRKVLQTLGLKSPEEEVSTYWRIPNDFKASDLKLRIKALKDEPIDENDIVYDEVIEYQTDEEDTIKAKKQQKRSKKTNQPKLLDKLLKKPKKQKTRKVKKNLLDIGTVRTLISEINGTHKEAIEWLAESISDAADDTEEANDEEDGIPLLPMLANQKDAMENDDFKKLLIALGIQPPIQQIETYWRIPIYLKATDLKKRAQILLGQEIEGENDVAEESQDENDENQLTEYDESSNNESSSDEAGDDFFDKYIQNKREKMQSLVFNASDNEDEIRKPLKKKSQRKLKSEKKDDNKDSKIKPNKNPKKPTEKKTKNKGALNLDDMILSNYENPLDSNPDLDFDSENLRLRLAELSDDEDDEMKSIESVPNASIRTKKKVNLIESDDDDDDNDKTISNATLNDIQMESQSTNKTDTNSAHIKRPRHNVLDSDSDEESNNENGINIDYNSITDTTTNEYDHSKDNLEKDDIPNLYQKDSMNDITGKLNQEEDDLMDDIEANNQSSIYNKTTEITKRTRTTTTSSTKSVNDDETIAGTSSTTNIINNIKSSKTSSILKHDNNDGSTMSMISKEITSITKTSTLLSSSTQSTQLNSKQKKISDIDNDNDKNDIINADETNDVHGSDNDGVINTTITSEKRKLKNNLSSDDDNEDIIVKRRKIVNTNDADDDDGVGVVDDEKDDNNINNKKIPEHKYHRIAKIIDDDDDDDE